MRFSLTEYARRRPFLYHITAKENLGVIRDTEMLYSTVLLVGRAGRPEVLKDRRRQSMNICLPEGLVVLRNQAPFHVGNIEFRGGWDLEHLLRALNNKIFFWPGTEAGPIDYGRRHFAAYRDTDAILRLPFTALLSSNPVFCKYNSGSPRHTGGRKSPRGPDTFLSVERWPFGIGEVAEVAFEWELSPPNSSTWSESVAGPWEPLFSHVTNERPEQSEARDESAS